MMKSIYHSDSEKHWF